LLPLLNKSWKGGKENGEDQPVTRKAREGDLTEFGESIMDFLVQSAIGHLSVGKAGGQFKIAAGWDFFVPFCPDLINSQVILAP
jgi:hypothetical protein